MSARRAMRLTGRAAVVAWAACALTATLAATRLGLAIIDPASSSSTGGPDVPGGGVPVAAFEAVILIALAVIGALVASRQPRNAVGWMLCVIPVSLGILILGAHAYWSFAFAGHTAAAELTAWLSSWVWIPAMVTTLTLFPLLFPTGRPLTPRWRPVVWIAIAAGALLFVGEAFSPGPFEDYPVENPFGAGVWAEVAGVLGFVLMLGATVASLTAIVIRFRRSRGDEREQLKWVTAAAAFFVLAFAFPADEITGQNTGLASLLLGFLVTASSVAVAILRYRLYDIDVVINRTLVYGALTMTLAVIYLGSVLLLQLALSGVTEGSGLAVAGSTLAVAALFRPARARIQEAVDRRFYRRKYDAQRTLEAFSTRLRDEVDLRALNSELSAVVRETLQPAHVSLWLRGGSAPGG